MTKSQSYLTDSAVYNDVLSLLRSGLWGEERFPWQGLKATDWDEVYKELRQQAVQFFPINILARENPSQSRRYITADAKNMMRWDKIMSEQQNLCFMLQDAGIPCTIVKGATIAAQYTNPRSRPLGDIDLLVSPEDFERACSLVSEGAEYLGDNFRHKEYKRNGVVVEVHQAFCTFKNPTKVELFDRRIIDAIDKAETVSIENYTFFRLPIVEHGLTLLEHIDIHLENGLGLRQIIDWMMFVDRELTDELWNAEFSGFLRTLEREKLAKTVTRMCQMYLGLRTDISWCSDADEDLCRELMEYILNQGNFGRKHELGTNRATAIISTSGNLFSLFKVLQSLGCENWEVLKRYPFLKPFAWLHQIIRYIRCGLSTKHPFKLLKNAIKRSKSQSSFFERLGVSQLVDRVNKTK